MRPILVLLLSPLVFLSKGKGDPNAKGIALDSVVAIARDAYIYGYPMVEHYRIIYASCQDRSYSKYAPFNAFYHEKDVASAEDTLFVAPNGDTPYSYAVLDIRQQPVILSIPPFDKGRYVGFPLYDMYTQIITTLSRRTIGDKGGNFMIVPLGWDGRVPKGIREVIRSESKLVYVLVRTQLFGRADLGTVHRLQSGYKVSSLSVYEGRPDIPSADLLVKPLPPENPKTKPDIRFFEVMNYAMSFCVSLPEEKELLERFARIGVIPGKKFEPRDSAIKAAVIKGMEEAKQMFVQKLPKVRSASELFGTRKQLKNDYLARAVGAWAGIYANQVEEFIGLEGFERQADGKPFDGHRQYRITFPKDGLPPVDGFWSVTVYTLPSRFMYPNVLNRNLISSVMVPDLKRNEDGSITIYLQHKDPGDEWRSNWLPCPEGPFTMSFRTYLPGEAIRNGSYAIPKVTATE